MTIPSAQERAIRGSVESLAEIRADNLMRVPVMERELFLDRFVLSSRVGAKGTGPVTV